MADATDTPSFRIDFANLCLWRSGATGLEERLSLTPKAFDVLRYLAENSGRLVTHDELLRALWRDVHVQPEVLKSHILAIRTVLGDKTSEPRFIETQRGRGYRFIGQLAGLASVANRPEAALELGIFAGRAGAVQELVALLERAASGQPQTVFISGEPGIGKTTLVEQFLRRAGGHGDLIVAEGHCIEGFAGAEPYYPILEALRVLCKGVDKAKVVRALLELAPCWATQLPDQIPAGHGMASRQPIVPETRSRMVREACSLFETLATERPLVLVLEDLHWADFATIDFMSALSRRRSSARLLLIGTYRPEDLKTARHPLKQMTRDLALRKYCREIELAPLSNAAIAELLAGRAEMAPVSPDFAHFIKERTGGNPLFMRVTLDYLLERGDVSRTVYGWQPLVPLNRLASQAPPTLARAIEVTIEGMTDEQRRVLEAASAAGDYFDPVTTARAADMPEQSFEAICESFAASILRRDELLTLPNNQLVRTYIFNHAVYRQVLYDRIGQVRRADLHCAIGERLEEIYPPDQRNDLAVRLAQHFSFARDWPRALDYLRSALHVANSRSARRDAIAILDRAVELAANLPDSSRIPAEIEFLERRAAIGTAAHDPKAREIFAQLAQRAGEHGDINAQCRALVGQSYILSWYDASRSLRLLDEVLALCERQSDPIQKDLTRITAHTRRLWVLGWNTLDSQKCEQALARLRMQSDPLAIAWAHANFSMLCLVSTRYQEAHDELDASYRVLSETSQNFVEADLARVAWIRYIGGPWSLLFLGQFGAALEQFGAGIGAFERNGDAFAVQSFQIFRSVVLFHAMDFEAVLQTCAPITILLAGHADNATFVLPTERRVALVFCGLAEVGLGNYAAALDYLRVAEGEMAEQPVAMDWYFRLPLEWGMVAILIAEGDRPAARERAERLCESAAQTDERAWQALAWEARSRAALSCGEAVEAVGHVAKALAACEGVQVPLAEWRVHSTAAITYKAVGDLTRARRHADLGAVVRKRLAESLPEGDPLRLKFERRSASLSGF